MSSSPATPEDRFASLVEALAGRPGVTCAGDDGRPARGFGSSALKVGGRIFAMLTRGRLVVKLPAPRVAALLEAGAGEPFDANKGKPMREWLTVAEGAEDAAWLALAEEALAFVGAPAGARG